MMLRLRRYRVFLAIVIAALLGAYYLIDARGWGGRSSLAFRNVRSNIDTTSEESISEEGRGRKRPKNTVFKNSKQDSQIALSDNDDDESSAAKSKSAGKGKGKGYDDDLEFPHKKPSEGPAIDERLPKGKHDPTPTSSSSVKRPHFTQIPENFPVPDDFVIKLPEGKPKAIPRIQHNFPRETTPEKKDRQKKLKKLKKTFLKHWAGYKEYAWDHDELKPVSGGYQDPFAGWRATLVDTLDMLWIMGLKEEFEEAVEEVATIDFTTTQKTVLPLFEVAIRYMGGLIAAYDISEAKYPVLLEKAEELGTVLMGAFDTPNRMPTTNYYWHTEDRERARTGGFATVLAEIGSLSMEFIRLAQITKNNRYYDAVARITDEFEIWQNSTKVPGLWPLYVDASGGCSAGSLAEEVVERQQGRTIPNEGTVNNLSAEKDSGRKLKDMAKDSSSKAAKATVDNAFEEKGKAITDKLPADLKDPLKSKTGKSTFESQVEQSMKAKEPVFRKIAEEHEADSDKSLRKRASPRYADADEVTTPRSKKPLAKSDDKDATSSKSGKKPKPAMGMDDDENDNVEAGRSRAGSKSSKEPESGGHAAKSSFADDEDEEPKRASGQGKASKASSKSGEIGHKGKSSFADDDAEELERSSTKSKSTKGGPAGKSKSKTSPVDDDEEDDEDDSSAAASKQKNKAGKKASSEASYHEKTKSKDQSSFGSDSESEQKAAKAKGKPTMKHKDVSSFGDDSDMDLSTSLPTFRHNKPMHKCVTRGLRSQYGKNGNDKFTFGGMADSVYEYLPKSYLLLGGLEPQYRRMHESTMKAAKEYLLFRTMTNDTKRPVYFTGDFNTQGIWNNETDRIQGSFIPHTGHLTCFQGAFIALAARAFRNEGDVDLARKLTDGCIWAYEQTTTGIMPELLDMVPCVNLTGSCKFNETKWWNAVDPWAADRVKVLQQAGQDTDRDTIAAALGDAKHDMKAAGIGKSEHSAQDLATGEKGYLPYSSSKFNAKVADLDHHKRSLDVVGSEKGNQWDYLIGRKTDPTVPSELDHIGEKHGADKRKAPTPAESEDESLAQPTTLPEYMAKQIKDQKLTPGITRMQAREYILRPEAIESVFYLYRITGDPYFRTKGWQMFEAIDNATSTTHGNSAIADVTANATNVSLRDKAESFWTAETLKYFWLLFSDPGVVSLDDWVFNTEAHPFRRPDLDVKREREAERMRRRKGMGGGMVWDLD